MTMKRNVKNVAHIFWILALMLMAVWQLLSNLHRSPKTADEPKIEAGEDAMTMS